MRKFIPLFLMLALFACRKAAFSDASAAVARADRSVCATKAPPVSRMIIRNANISMIVDDTASSLEKITAAAESVGGYVSDTKVWRDGEQLRGTITARIPADRLSAALAVIRKLAVRIQSETVGSQEVTQEYVDLESQLRNLEAAETELRALMTTIRQRSKKASEVLEIYQQLTTIRAQIEQTKGRMRYLSQMTALAVVQVDLVPNAVTKPVVEAGWQPLAIWVALYVLPLLAVLAAVAFVAYRGINAAWKMRRSPSS